MNIDMSDILSDLDKKILILNLSRFKYKGSISDYINILDSVETISETTEVLTDEQIFDIVNKVADETVEDVDGIVDDVAEDIITVNEAKEYYRGLFKYFEQKDILDPEVLKHFSLINDKLYQNKFIQSKLKF